MENPVDPDRDDELFSQTLDECIAALDWAIKAAWSIEPPERNLVKQRLRIVRGLIEEPEVREAIFGRFTEAARRKCELPHLDATPRRIEPRAGS